jgi:hypothetical protein
MDVVPYQISPIPRITRELSRYCRIPQYSRHTLGVTEAKNSRLSFTGAEPYRSVIKTTPHRPFPGYRVVTGEHSVPRQLERAV